MKKDWMVKESELDDDQVRVLMAVLDKSMVVRGCAGSGKSVLALMKAQRIQNECGNDYEVIVYTKALAAYMSKGRTSLGLKGRFTYFDWWDKKLHRPEADYVIVDEIQDFTEEEIMQFVASARKNFFFFGDSAQSVYKSYKETLSVEDIGYLFPNKNRPKEFELYRNYRLPIPVARLAQYVGVGLPPFDEHVYKSGNTRIPYLLGYRDLSAQVEAIGELIKNGVYDDVAILCQNRDMVENVCVLLESISIMFEKNKGMENRLDFSTSLPKVLTVHSAKGLQFGVVFVVATELYNETIAQRMLLYVAMTRTYDQLFLMYSGAIPSLFARVPSDFYFTSTTPSDIEDI